MTERTARNKLAKLGYIIQKRKNSIDLYHSGCYRIINAWNNTIEAGENFELTMEDVEKFINEK